MWHPGRACILDPWSRLESPEMGPQIHGQQILTKGADSFTGLALQQVMLEQFGIHTEKGGP